MYSNASKARNVPVGSHVLNETSNRVALGGLCLLHEAFDLESAQFHEPHRQVLTTPGHSFDLVLISLEAYTLASPT